MPLDLEIQAFANMLQEIEALLIEHDQTHWAAKVAGCRATVEHSDVRGLYQFLSLFGGMGSLNDVVLCRDGTPLSSSNDKLHALLSQAYEAGRRLERNA